MTAGGLAVAAGQGGAPEDSADPAGDLLRRLRHLDDDAARRPLLIEALSSSAAGDLVAALKAEAERLWYVDPHASLRLAEAIVCTATLADHPEHAALGLMARGDALFFLGRYPEALACLDQAGQAYIDIGHEVGWARTRIGWVVAAHRLGRGIEALAPVDRAREVLVRHGEWRRAAGLIHNTAWVSTELGRYQQALGLYDEAQRLYESLGPTADVRAARTRANKAIIHTLLGDFGAALDQHQVARDVFARHDETLAVLRQDQNIAYVYAGLGDYTRALRLLTDAFATAERAGLDADAAGIALNLVECYLSLNQHGAALDLARETIERYERCGTPTEAAKARIACAAAYTCLGEVGPALDMLEVAARTFTSAGLEREVAVSSLQRASLHLAEGSVQAAFEEARRASVLFDSLGLVVRRAQAQLVQARASLALGDHDLAAQLAGDALATTLERSIGWLAHESYHVLAGVAEATGDLPGALGAYRRAIASIEQVQSRLASELRTTFLDDKLAVYGDAIDLCLRLDRPSLAFEYLERAKSRALVDYLAGNPEVRLRADHPVDQSLVDELARLRQEHNWFYSHLYGLGLSPGAGDRADGGAEAAVLGAAIRDREKRIARILERLALHAYDLEGVAAPPSDAAFVRPALDPRTVLLQYYFREDGGAVFVLSGDQLKAVPLATGARHVQRLLHRWQLNLDATARALGSATPLAGLHRNAIGILGALYRALVEPVASALTGNVRLIVVPYGPAHAIPWHALYDGRQHLLERLEVVTCPSSSLLRLCAGQRLPAGRDPGSALVAAFSGGRLPHVLDEAHAVARLFPGECFLEEAATEARLVAAAPRHGILHLAAHGEARLDNPTFAHLQLADGQLTTADVFNLRLEGALVTLSACETGRSVVTGGDELIGLSRGFLFAGASALVQSLWRVEDGSTARLMARFYTALRAGRPRGAALREAQLTLLGEGLPAFFWAPFQLVGDAGPLASPDAAPPQETTHEPEPQ